jgi:hypothetical protein
MRNKPQLTVNTANDDADLDVLDMLNVECDSRGVIACLVHETRQFWKASNGLDKNLQENVSECSE